MRKASVSVVNVATDGNVFAVIGKIRQALRQAGLADLADELTTRVAASHSYKEALTIAQDYVDCETARKLQELIASGGKNQA